MSLENTETPASAPLAETYRESPGAQIREARERRGYSLDDLAIQTKLSRSALDALERDDFGALLEPVYVRGYYRKCAKVLGLSDQRLIEAYTKQVTPKTPQLPAKLRLASGTDLGSGTRLPVPLAIGAAVLAVVVCGAVWMAREGGELSAPQTTSTLHFAPTAAEEPTSESMAAMTPADAAIFAQVSDPVVTTTADAPAAAATEVASAATPLVPTTGSDGAVLKFGSKSWVRIDDAQGKVLLRGEFAAGETRAVQGAAPLNVHLGNASAVKVEYGGQAVDFSSQMRSSGTARFTLPLTSN